MRNGSTGHQDSGRTKQGNASARSGRPVQERVVETLRHGISTGYLVGGTRLVQPRIAEALGVSTAPVREALRQLAAEGLVQFDDRGAAVHELNRSELVEVYELRQQLEPIAIVRAAKEASDETLVQAIELVAAMQDVTDPTSWTEKNARFHSVLEVASGSPRLVAILSQLHALSTLYVTHSLLAAPERLRRGNDEHQEILEAIINRDADAAVEAVLRHLDGTLRTLLQVRELDASVAACRVGRWWGPVR